MWSQCESPSKLHFAWEKKGWRSSFKIIQKIVIFLRVSLGFWNAPWKINSWNLKNGPLEKENSFEPNHFGVPAVNFPGCISVQKKITRWCTCHALLLRRQELEVCCIFGTRDFWGGCSGDGARSQNIPKLQGMTEGWTVFAWEFTCCKWRW